MNSFLISVVIPVFNENSVILDTYKRTQKVLQQFNYELIFVDDGSTDGSQETLATLPTADPSVQVIFLSRNFGHQNAVSAGLLRARGDAVIIMDADLQDPPELIVQFVQLWQQGNDVVYGVRQARPGESILKRASAHLFYRTLRRMSRVDIPLDVGDFRLMSRRVVDIVNAMPESHRFLRGMVSWVGFRQVGVPYMRGARTTGHSHYSWQNMWDLSLDGVTSFTVAPLRWVRRIALVIAAVAFAVSLRLIYAKLHNPHALVLGWTSMMVTVLWLGALQLGVLGIIGEYVGRIAEQGRSRPHFVVDQVITSEQTSESSKILRPPFDQQSR